MYAFLGAMEVTEDDIDLFERLLEVNGTNGSVFIYDKNMLHSLRANGYVQMNNIGWVWGTEKLRNTLPRLKRTLDHTSFDICGG